MWLLFVVVVAVVVAVVAGDASVVWIGVEHFVKLIVVAVVVSLLIQSLSLFYHQLIALGYAYLRDASTNVVGHHRRTLRCVNVQNSHVSFCMKLEMKGY